MLNKANFIVTEFASKEETRYTMQAIQVRPEATVATNGHFLGWVSTNGADPQSFPVIEGFAGGQKEFAPFLLDVESAKQIAKALPKKTTLPVLQYAAVNVKGPMVTDATTGEKHEDTSKAESVALAVTDLERPQVFRPHIPSGQFPQFQAVIPDWEKDVAFEITVSPDYLATIAKAFSSFQKEKSDERRTVRMKFYKQDIKEASESRDGKRHVYDHAIRFDATNDSQGMTVVLMPMRDEGDLYGTYGYKEREAAREEARKAEEARKREEANEELRADEHKAETGE